MARGYLAQIRANQPHQFTEPLLDYVPRVTPKWVKPTWLAPYIEILEEAVRNPIRAVIAAPPQHGKTETTLHALCWALRRKPGTRSAYATYNQDRSAKVERKARSIAERDRISLEFRQNYWYDPATEGQIVWTSRNGGLTGDPVDGLLVIDDILKDRRDAESATSRQDCIDFFDDVAEPRCHPTASIIVMATRWHPEDLSGLLIKRGWKYINLKALADGETDSDDVVISDPLGRKLGEPLCEERKARAELEAKRVTNIYSFASLYQGEPRPRGGTIFNEPTYYTELPRSYRVGYGVDLAYTAKSHADFSVCVRMLRDGETYYVTDVVRKQVDAPSFLLTLKARQSEMRGPMLWLMSGTEKGAAQFIRVKLPEFKTKQVTADKFQRALPVSEAWNAGRIKVPHDAPWLELFLDEVMNFTGVNDSHDDQVDALAAGFQVLHTVTRGGVAGRGTGPSRAI